MSDNHAVLGQNPLVREVMSLNIVSVNEDDSIPKTLQMFETNKISAAPVKNQNGNYTGVVTKSDLSKLDVILALIQAEATMMESSLLIKNIMNPVKLMSISQEKTLRDASRQMIDNQIHHIFVHDDTGDIVGIVSTFDIAKIYAQHRPD